ncbi:MAG: hypothetical protein AABY26_05490 [Nanoarchaeota archaeon]
MEATTIKIYPDTKNDLDELRNDDESYDSIITKLLSEVKHKHLIKELVEAYGKKAEEDKQVEKEWNKTSADWD